MVTQCVFQLFVLVASVVKKEASAWIFWSGTLRSSIPKLLEVINWSFQSHEFSREKNQEGV